MTKERKTDFRKNNSIKKGSTETNNHKQVYVPTDVICEEEIEKFDKILKKY